MREPSQRSADNAARLLKEAVDAPYNNNAWGGLRREAPNKDTLIDGSNDWKWRLIRIWLP